MLWQAEMPELVGLRHQSCKKWSKREQKKYSERVFSERCFRVVHR